MIGWVGNGDAGPERGRSRGKSGDRWLDDWLPGLIAHEKFPEKVVVVVAVECFKSRDREGWGGSVWTREIREIREFHELPRLATIFFWLLSAVATAVVRVKGAQDATSVALLRGERGGRQKCSHG